ncbi:MAG: hypothetical protein WCX22_05490 [Methanoregula sp.]
MEDPERKKGRLRGNGREDDLNHHSFPEISYDEGAYPVHKLPNNFEK